MGGISDNTFGGGTPKTSEKKYWNGTIPWIQSSDLTINNLFLKKTKKFITENAISESATKVVPAQSIAVVTRVGVGKLALIPFTYTTSQDFLSFSNLNIDKYFAVYNMYALLKKISQNLQGTSIKGVTKSDLLDKKIYVSNFIEEQQAIGSLFKKIDNLIVLQQRKIDTLKLLKKALLQQVFPEKRKDIPKVRFANFNETYQQRKLKELLIKNSKKNKDLSISNVESVSNKAGFIKQTEQFENYSVASSNLSNYYVITPKQFAYNPSRINVGSIAYKKEKDDISVVSPLYVSFSTKNTIIDDNYLWFWFKTGDFERQRQKYSEGGVRDTLSFNQLSEMKLMLPNIKEQKLFGEFVKKSEYHLKLIEQKFNGLKTIKKVLLQKMFI